MRTHSETASAESATIDNFAYAPKTLTIKVGHTVKFTNHDSVNHTVTSDRAGAFDTGNLKQGQSHVIMFSKRGTYPYHCQFHPFMHGRIVVR